MKRMTLAKTGLLSITVPVIFITWLAAEAATEGSHDNLPATFKADLPNATTVSVSFRDGLFSVEAKAGTWRQVLNEITEQTGIRFHHSLPFEGSVTMSFANLPVRQAIERLFGSETDFVFRYGGTADLSSSLPKEVWVLGKVVGDSAARIPDQTIQRLAASATQQNPAGQALDKPNDTTEVARTELERLMEMTKSSNAATRVEALSMLADSGTGDQEAIRSDLAAALTEQDPEARSLAVQALARHGGPEAMNHLSQALRDLDLSVRITAVESAPLKGEGLALLREALTDTDEMIRSSARDRLQEAESQEAD